MTDHVEGRVVAGPVVSGSPGSQGTLPTAARQSPIFWPGEFVPEEHETARLVPRPTLGERLVRPVVYGASAVVAVIGAVAVYALLAPASRGATRAGGSVAALPVELIDGRADTVVLAVGAFELRATMFERRQMGCADLARGLVQVDQGWMAYSLARREGPVSLDPQRAARDRDLFASVKSVERRFESSGCSRP